MDESNFTGISSNISSPGLPQPSWNQRGLIPAVVLSFCFLLGVPGNIAVIILKPNWEHLLMLNLAISDLLGLLALPPKIYASLFHWKFGLVACKILNYLLYTSIYGSQLTVTVLGIQRYLQVVHQEKWHQGQKCVRLVLLWLVAVILSIPVLVDWQVITNQQKTVCQPQYSSEAQWVVVLLTETLFGFFSVLLQNSRYVVNMPNTNTMNSPCVPICPLHSVHSSFMLREIEKDCADVIPSVKVKNSSNFRKGQKRCLTFNLPTQRTIGFKNSAEFLLFTLWLVASILAIPALVVQNLQTDQQWIICKGQYSSDAQWVAVLLTETVFGFICFILVAFSYVCLQKRVNQSVFFNNPQTTRLLTSIIVSFFVLWAPYHTTNVLGVAAICLKNDNLLNFCDETWNICGAVTFINSCLNPLLYAFTSHKMCSFVGVLCKHMGHCQSNCFSK
uniref:G-protein coupled receptors family 1 profile domain-containing protein n=1 Tax=Xiphophorus maculatus TaxID=8083 RepID=M4A7C5_XIPMA